MFPLLSPGTPIAVVAPSRRFDPDRLAFGLALARARGHVFQVPDDLLRPHLYLAATDDHRRAQLAAAMTDPGVGAVWAVRGGYGVTRLLDGLPFDHFVKKPLIGFSDLTALHIPWHAKGGLAIHGPMLHTLDETDEASIEHLFALLAGERVAPLQGETWIPGEAHGWLCGGNLCLLAATCGTPWQLRARGGILVIEEVNEQPYRIDRFLQQLLSAGVLDGVRGIALGAFTDCEAAPDVPWTLRDVLLDRLRPLGVPLVVDLPIGHQPANRAFPWGRQATLGNGELCWEPDR